jgi:Tfp pilus assembly protein FimT
MKTNSGITLVELIIVMAVLMIALGAVFIGTSGGEYRALQNAAVSLRADIRYAQHRSIMEGRQFGVHLEPRYNRYHIVTTNPLVFHRTVYFQNGVRLISTNHPSNRVTFLPRGTGVAGTIILSNGNYFKNITTTVSGGHVRLHDITRGGT